jgi:hypothetical protein
MARHLRDEWEIADAALRHVHLIFAMPERAAWFSHCGEHGLFHWVMEQRSCAWHNALYQSVQVNDGRILYFPQQNDAIPL